MAKRRKGVRVIAQKHDFDCGVAALAMFLNIPYGDVAAACRELWGSTKPAKRGLGIYHLEQLAEHFERPLKRLYKRRDYLEGQSGILGMVGGEMSWAGHWVVFKAGVIIDPDNGGLVWEALDYLKEHNTRPATLLVEA